MTHCGKQPPAGSPVRDVTRKDLQGQMTHQEDRNPFGCWGAGAGKPWAYAQAESSVGPLGAQGPWGSGWRGDRRAATREQRLHSRLLGAPPNPGRSSLLWKRRNGEETPFSRDSWGGSPPQCCSRWQSLHANRGYDPRAGNQKPLSHRAKMSVCDHPAVLPGTGPFPPRWLLEVCPRKASLSVPLG